MAKVTANLWRGCTPIYFMGMVMGFRSHSNFLPVMVVSAIASIVAFHVVGSPWHVSVGGIAGILVAVLRTPPKTSTPSADGVQP